MTIEQIIEEATNEVERAQKKFPHWPDDIIHASAIVNEESGELIRAALQQKYENGSITECKKEAIQTAAMAIRFLINIKYYQ